MTSADRPRRTVSAGPGTDEGEEPNRLGCLGSLLVSIVLSVVLALLLRGCAPSTAF